MTENVTGYNWKLEVGAASGTSLPAIGSDTFTQILDIEDLEPPSSTRETQAWFVLDQAAAKTIPGSLTFEPCTATLTRAYSDTGQNRLQDDAESASPVRRNYRITASDTGLEVQSWQGYCTGFKISSVTNQDRAKVELTIEVDGLPSRTR